MIGDCNICLIRCSDMIYSDNGISKTWDCDNEYGDNDNKDNNYCNIADNNGWYITTFDTIIAMLTITMIAILSLVRVI